MCKCKHCGAEVKNGYSDFCGDWCKNIYKPPRKRPPLGGGGGGGRGSYRHSPWRSISPFHSKFGW